MVSVLLDTNIILDYLSVSRPCHGQAVDLLEFLLESDIEPVVSASSVKDAYYILCRHYKREPLVRQRLHDFLQIVPFEELTHEIMEAAFSSDEPDLEDAILRATAELRGCTAIITRDAAAYAAFPVPAMDCRAGLAFLQGR